MKKLTKIIKAAAVAAIIGLQLTNVIQLHAIIEVMPRQYECETCGAHITEAWHTRNKNGELVHICERCADKLDK